MKTRRFALCLATVFLVAIYINIQRSHTFTLSNDEGTIKTEQIQPLWGTVKVSGDCDTEVVFTDVETGEKYRIGYITQGVTERIKLERGKWYKVAGGGNLRTDCFPEMRFYRNLGGRDKACGGVHAEGRCNRFRPCVRQLHRMPEFHDSA